MQENNYLRPCNEYFGTIPLDWITHLYESIYMDRNLGTAENLA